MSSPRPFNVSSPLTATDRGRHKSRFTYKQLSQLGLSSTTTPLRVIALLDLDAFYAQCEMVRLNVAPDQPLAVQQWQGLIAINYPARAFGLNRHVTVTEAQKACPTIIVQHVATWREGQDKWAYHHDAFKNSATHKVSLDPYRLQSRRIISLIKDILPPAPIQRVEKASVDEVFLDLSAQVHAELTKRFPEQLKGPPPYDDPSENLPAPPTTALDWNADALVDLATQETEEEAPDWDDVAMLIGSEIVRSVRATIKDRLKFTCSAGLARNKMLAKLGAGHKKPNNQTVIRNRAVQHFLSSFKFTKIRNLGGKLGDEVVSTFNTDTVSELRAVPLEQLKQKLGDDTGTWLWQIVRGEDTSEVNSRTQIKSMLSAKSFRPSINSFEQAVRWLRIFVADIFSRLVEEGVLENRRRPKTINLHHRQGSQSRSKQAPIPHGKGLDETTLFDLAKDLMAQVIVDGRAWPCSNLSLSVGGLEDGITGNQGIGGFLVRGQEVKMIQENVGSSHGFANGARGGRPSKRRRTHDNGRISSFFAQMESAHQEPMDFDEVPSAQRDVPSIEPRTDNKMDKPVHDRASKCSDDLEHDAPASCHGLHSSSSPQAETENTNVREDVIPKIEDTAGSDYGIDHVNRAICSRCHKSLMQDEEPEHRDWHMAEELQQQEQAGDNTAAARPVQGFTPGQAKPTRGRARLPGGRSHRGRSLPSGDGLERGQSRLAFGK